LKILKGGEIMSKFVDMTGWVMSEHGVPDSLLTVIRRADDYVSPSGARHTKWVCKCSCGNQKEIVSSSKMLRNGDIKSCGCLRKTSTQIVGKNNKQFNDCDLSGDYGILYTSKGEEIWFDLEDYDKIKGICWWYDVYGYACGRNTKTNEIIKLHQFIMEPIPDGMMIDHKQHPNGHDLKKDNRKSNLRLVTNSENQMNIGDRKNNTSGKIGVCKTKNNTWLAYIQIKGKGKFYKTFKTYEDAVQWRVNKEVEYFKNNRYNANN
jgi:hypothetical protein